MSNIPKKASDERHKKESLRIIKQCPVCDAQYKAKDIQQIDKEFDTRLLHFTCSSCQHALMALVSLTGLGLSVIGVLADLDASDAVRLRGSESISQDELLEFYNFIHNHEDKFRKYLHIK